MNLKLSLSDPVDGFGNNISEIKGLETLTKLEGLLLNNNKISEIKGLENLVNLEDLEISQNQITEITGLDSLVKIEDIALCDNNISDVRGFGKPFETLKHLKGIYLDGNPVSIKELDKLGGYRRGKTITAYRT